MIKRQARSSGLKHTPRRYWPREKLQQQGLAALSEAELWALILGSGSQQANVLEVGRRVSQQLQQLPLGQWERLERPDGSKLQQQLNKIRGVGRVGSARIVACLEVAARRGAPPPLLLHSPRDIFAQARDLITYKQEHCVAFYLNGRGELLERKTLAIGSLNQNFLEAREIFAPAMILPASQLALAHNHPSGSLEPSHEDLLFTEKTSQLAELLGLQLIDHLIISKRGFLSLKEKFSDLFAPA